MYMYMYVYMHICMYVCMYACIYVCMCALLSALNPCHQVFPYCIHFLFASSSPPLIPKSVIVFSLCCPPSQQSVYRAPVPASTAAPARPLGGSQGLFLAPPVLNHNALFKSRAR